MNPAEQGLTLLSGQDTLDKFFSLKGNKERKKITDIAWENKERKK